MDPKPNWCPDWTLNQTGVLTGVRTHRETSQVLVRRGMTIQEHSSREQQTSTSQRKRHETDASLICLKRNQTCRHLDLNIKPPLTVRKKISIV